MASKDSEKTTISIRQTEDLILIRKIREGDVNAFGVLIDRYLNQLLGFFRYLKAPEATIEDLAQETFERVVKKLDKYDEQKKFSTWLFTVARNIYFDICRSESRKKEYIHQVMPESSTTPEDEIIEKYSAIELLCTLSDKDRFLVEMRIFQEMPFSEIATLTGEVDATLRSRFFRIISKLRLSVKNRKEPQSAKAS